MNYLRKAEKELILQDYSKNMINRKQLAVIAGRYRNKVKNN